MVNSSCICRFVCLVCYVLNYRERRPQGGQPGLHLAHVLPLKVGNDEAPFRALSFATARGHKPQHLLPIQSRQAAHCFLLTECCRGTLPLSDLNAFARMRCALAHLPRPTHGSLCGAQRICGCQALAPLQVLPVEQGLAVLDQYWKLTGLQHLHLEHVQAIFAVLKLHGRSKASDKGKRTHLNDTSVTVSDGLVVAHHEPFQMLDEATLQVSTAACLHCSVHEALTQKLNSTSLTLQRNVVST